MKTLILVIDIDNEQRSYAIGPADAANVKRGSRPGMMERDLIDPQLLNEIVGWWEHRP